MTEYLAEMDISELTQMLSTSSHGHFDIQKTQDIKSAAAFSVGVSHTKDSTKVQLRCLLAHLEFLQSQIEEVDENIQQPMVKKESFVITIPVLLKSETLTASIVWES